MDVQPAPKAAAVPKEKKEAVASSEKKEEVKAAEVDPYVTPSAMQCLTTSATAQRLQEEEEKKRKRAEKFGTAAEPVRPQVHRTLLIPRPTKRQKFKVSEVSGREHCSVSTSAMYLDRTASAYITSCPKVNQSAEGPLVLHLLRLVDRRTKLDLLVAKRCLLFLYNLVGAKQGQYDANILANALYRHHNRLVPRLLSVG